MHAVNERPHVPSRFESFFSSFKEYFFLGAALWAILHFFVLGFMMFVVSDAHSGAAEQDIFLVAATVTAVSYAVSGLAILVGVSVEFRPRLKDFLVYFLMGGLLSGALVGVATMILGRIANAPIWAQMAWQFPLICLVLALIFAIVLIRR